MSVLFSKLSETCFCGRCWNNIGVGIAPYESKQPDGEVNPAKYDMVKEVFDRYSLMVQRLTDDVKSVFNDFRAEVNEFLDERNEGKYTADFYHPEAAAMTLALADWPSVLKNILAKTNTEATDRLKAEGEELVLRLCDEIKDIPQPENPVAENPFATLLRMMGPPTEMNVHRDLPPSINQQSSRSGFGPEVDGITDQRERVLKKMELLKQKLGINGNASPLDNLFNSIDPGTKMVAQVPGDELPQELKDMADANGFINLYGKTDAIPASLMPLLGIALLGALSKGMIRKADELESDGVPAGQYIDEKSPFVNPVFNG